MALANSMLVCGGCLGSYLTMLVGGRTMHARECKGMLVGAGDLLRQIAATKGIKKEHEELELAKVPKSCLKSVQK